MHTHYHDILSQLGEPSWWDECAVPRYCDFSPQEIAYIYANACAFLLIECQGCGASFKVAMSSRDNDMASAIRGRRIHFGDPPNSDCCSVGSSMNSIPIRVLEYWQRELGRDWQRRSELEVEVKPDWALNVEDDF